MTLSYFLGLFIKFMHIFLPMIIIYIVASTNDFSICLMFNIIIFLIVFHWLIFNTCLLTHFQNYLLDVEPEDLVSKMEQKTYFDFFNAKIVIFNHNAHSTYTYMYLIFYFYSIYKLYYIYHNKI